MSKELTTTRIRRSSRGGMVTIRVAALVLVSISSRADDVTLDFSSFIGGDGGDRIIGAATDADGAVYVAGTTDSNSFPGAEGIGGNAVFVIRLDLEASPPVVVWRTIFDGDNVEIATGIAVGSSGVYVTGWTNSASNSGLVAFPSGWDPVKDPGTDRDPFVMKLDRVTGAVVAGTHLQASGSLDLPDALAVDGASGRVYVSGRTNTKPTEPVPFPVTDGSAVNCRAKGQCNVDLFLAVFSADLETLENGTVIGGSDIDAQIGEAEGLAVGADGTAYIAAYTESDDFPVTDGSSLSGREDALLVAIELLPAGATSVTLAGYIGGGSVDRALSVELDGGTLWLGGETSSSDFPGAASGGAGQSDAFVAKIDTTLGFTIVHTTLLGGSASDGVVDMALDGAGNVFATGGSSSTDFPVTSDAVDATHNGSEDVWIAKLDASGSIVHATLLGGQLGDEPGRLALSSLPGDPEGTIRVRVGGGTGSSAFPVTADAIDSTYGGGADDGFIASYRFVAGPPAENCTNGVDDDGDGFADCGDPDCQVDDDEDGVLAAPCGFDCDDGDPAIPGPGEICGDGKDNDCNGLTDCEESPLCDSDPACQTPTCGQKNAPCASDDDCCSLDCKPNGRCAGGSGAVAGLRDPEVSFLRGDANQDGTVDLSDGIATLAYLFGGGRTPPCHDASDADDSGAIDISDAIATFTHLFAAGPTIAEPFPEAGSDPTPDSLGCRE